MSAAPRLEAAPSLVEALLAEQQSLPAVEVFARRHEAGELPRTARRYEERIPVGRAPGAGQQLAFQVDLDACTGCKACVTACHSLNGLAEDETWRDVGLLVGAGEGAGFQQTVTTACHHCEDPACLAGCPVKAYEKDAATGIVRHLDDQCIGCQYCLLKCPYDVPRYSRALGIVRKCDMCTGRLAEGEAPACVQGCPNGAISIRIVDVGSAPPELLPGAGDRIPDSAYTRPTTRYVSRRPARPLQPGDEGRLAPAPAHDPLAVMLVLMQLSVGTLAFDALASASGHAGGAASALRLGLAAASATLGLGAATLHLGRPLYAFRAFLGWRTSWMSREILTFGAYVPALAALAAGAAWVAADAPGAERLAPWLPAARAAALLLGAAGTACSAMIYVDTRRAPWAWRRTGPTFAATLVGLGALGAAAATLSGGGEARLAGALLLGGLAVLAAKLAGEAWALSAAGAAGGAGARSVRLLRGPLRARVRARALLASSGLALAATAAALAFAGAAPSGLAAGALLAAALGEIVERHLYFTSEASPGMPGA